MFYTIKIRRAVQLIPQQLRQINEIGESATVKYHLVKKFEGSFDPDVGYIVIVLECTSISKGMLQPLTGEISYKVEFDAVVLYPMVGEVVDAVVCKVQKSRITICYMGIYGSVKVLDFPDREFVYHAGDTENGDANNAYFKYTPKIDDTKDEDDEEQTIQQGSIVRARIIRRTCGATGFFLLATLNEPHMGVLPSKTE